MTEKNNSPKLKTVGNGKTGKGWKDLKLQFRNKLSAATHYCYINHVKRTIENARNIEYITLIALIVNDKNLDSGPKNVFLL